MLIQKLSRAIDDLFEAIRRHRTWLHLGFVEVKQRYQRSVLGPWWITLSMLLFISAMGTIFSRLFGVKPEEYIPFFTTGYLLWTFISSCISESTDLFKSNGNFIKQTKLPFHLYVLKFLTKNLILLAHNLVVYLGVLWYFHINPGWNCLFALGGFVLLVLNLYWICLLTALVSTRFRDMVPIITNCLQILFFVTPISWTPKLLDENSLIVKWNPFVYFLELVRMPLLGSLPSLHMWIVCGCIAIAGFILSFLIFSHVRTNVPFWID